MQVPSKFTLRSSWFHREIIFQTIFFTVCPSYLILSSTRTILELWTNRDLANSRLANSWLLSIFILVNSRLFCRESSKIITIVILFIYFLFVGLFLNLTNVWINKWRRKDIIEVKLWTIYEYVYKMWPVIIFKMPLGKPMCIVQLHKMQLSLP